MRGILGIIYVFVGAYGFGQVITMPGFHPALAFCAGATIAVGGRIIVEAGKYE